MKTHLLPIWLLLAPFFCAAQVGIGTTTPNIKSLLDLSSSTQGLLLPRMTWQQKTQMGLSSEEYGMMVYQTDQPSSPNQFPKG